MKAVFQIQSSDPKLLAKARQLAESFSQPYIQAGVSGVVFLGAIARGYFDSFADIDVIFYKSSDQAIEKPPSYVHIDGFEIHSDLQDEQVEMASAWEMAKRWAFSHSQIYYDPHGWVRRLLAEKIPLRAEERRWLMIEGMTQSDWYICTLTKLWIRRGNPISAQQMFDQGLTHFFDALFGLNHELVADVKWRYYAVERLPLLPPGFREQIQEVLRCLDFTVEDIERRQQAFTELWQWALPKVEQEVGMTLAEFSLLV
jgi:hypothetical protein